MRTRIVSVLVPSASVITAIITFLVLSGMVIQGFNPLTSVVEATSSGSFRYLTNMLPYETTEISYNMDDLYDTTHLYDFSSKDHFGEIDGTLKFESGIYGRSLQWPGGQIKGDDLDIVGMSFTIEAWIFPTSADLLVLIGYESVFPIVYKATNGSMLYQYSGGSAAFYSNQPININVWTHVALVYDASSSAARWYLNGLEQGSKQVGPRVLDGPWSIGRMGTGVSTYEWKGKIDEFRIYKGNALAQDEIQKDMETSIGHKLTLTGLIPYSDIAQLRYSDGEFAEEHKLEDLADSEGQVEFSVYSFSGRTRDYAGIIRILRPDRTYTSPVLRLSWEDVYHFSVSNYFNEATLAALISSLIVAVPIIALLIYRYARRRSQSS